MHPAYKTYQKYYTRVQRSKVKSALVQSLVFMGKIIPHTKYRRKYD